MSLSIVANTRLALAGPEWTWMILDETNFVLRQCGSCFSKPSYKAWRRKSCLLGFGTCFLCRWKWWRELFQKLARKGSREVWRSASWPRLSNGCTLWICLAQVALWRWVSRLEMDDDGCVLLFFVIFGHTVWTCAVKHWDMVRNVWAGWWSCKSFPGGF